MCVCVCVCVCVSYENLEELGEEVPWFCAMCGSPNSKTVYDLHSLEHSSVYSPPELPEDCTTPTEQHMDRPLHSSTPTRASQQDKWKRRPLRLINMNCHSAVGKKTEISNLIDSTKPDVIVATETWLDPSIKNNTILPDSYEVFRKDRNHFSGGVLIAVKKGLECFEVSELQKDCELIWVCIKLRGRKTLYICAYYRPDKSHKTSLELFRVSPSKAATISNAHIVIAGDLHLPSWDWKQMRLKPNPSYAQLHEDFINTLSDFGLVQLVEEPTREANTLDLIISNCPQLHEDFINTLSDFGLVQLVEEPTREANTLDLIISICPLLIPRVEVLPGLSDHGAVFCEIKVHTQMRKQTPRQILLYAKADWEGLRATMTNLHERIKEEKSTASTEELWTLFRDKLQTAIKDHIPHKQARVKENKPWVSPAFRRLIKKRDRVFKKMRSMAQRN